MFFNLPENLARDFFKSSNKFGIPELLKNKCYNVTKDLKLKVWGVGNNLIEDESWFVIYRSSNHHKADPLKSYLGFYIHDDRFEVTWNRPVYFVNKLLKNKYKAVVSPNFSLWVNDPIALQIWNVFRARWVSRYWQECGIDIIPDVNWSTKESFNFCFLGIPKGVPLVSIQTQNISTVADVKRFKEGLKVLMNKIQPQNILVYSDLNKLSMFKGLLEKDRIFHCDTIYSVLNKRKRRR
tara:strand:- start:2970 stop:3683 length:714 start_codon:yes stop_codon:yes gene_type:complete